MKRSDLHPYQLRAVDFIKSHPQAALFMEMGLGKSVCTLTAIADLMLDLELTKVLVVGPRKVIETTWTDEVEKWEHLRWLRIVRVIGTEKKRIQAVNTPADIYVISRDSFVWLARYHRAKMPYDMIVLDELTSFKSTDSKRFKAMRLTRAQYDRIVGLTGTPAPNGYLDIFGQMYCIDGGKRLGRYKTHYLEKYFNYVQSEKYYTLRCDLKAGAKKEIDKKISDIALVMKAEDYLTLPKRIDIVKTIELPEKLMKQYRQFQKDCITEILAPASSRQAVVSPQLSNQPSVITAANAAALMGKLAQFCNGAIYDEDKAVHEVHHEKLDALAEIVESAGSPVLVFYQYQHDVPRIVSSVCGALASQPSVRVYKGEQDFRDWNAGKIDVLLAHPASCSYGLNLQQGGHIIVWFGTGWNLELYQQANARLDRQGQTHPVLVYNLVCRGTVDERALAALSSKADTQASLMNAVKQLINEQLIS